MYNDQNRTIYIETVNQTLFNITQDNNIINFYKSQ